MNAIRTLTLAAIAAASITLGTAPLASAEVVTRSIEYQRDGTTFEGYLAYDDARTGKRPGVLVVHEWWGLDDFTKGEARRLAEMGYVAFAPDMYGKGVHTTNPQEAAKLAGAVRSDPDKIRGRAQAALAVLEAQPNVDATKLAATGYCFGGGVAFELAYSGAPLKAAVSFHGSLPAAKPSDYGKTKAKLLALHGGDDPFVKPEVVAAFEKAVSEGKLDAQLLVYSGAVHTFMNPESGKAGMTGSAYDERTAKRAWSQMKAFFAETLGSD